MKQHTLSYVFVSLFALVGLGCGILCLKLGLDRQRMLREGIAVIGIVTDLNYSSNKGSTTVAPVVSYTTKTGDTLLYSSNFYTNINPPQIGDKRKLWYDPANPDKVELGKEGLFIIGMLLLFCLVFGIIGFWGLIWLIRQRQMYQLLAERGKIIQTHYERIKKYWWAQGNLKVISSWTDPKTQIPYTFYSGFLADDRGLDRLENARDIPVTINPENPKQYWVDLSVFGLKVMN